MSNEKELTIEIEYVKPRECTHGFPLLFSFCAPRANTRPPVVRFYGTIKTKTRLSRVL
jgi:hypothetical protein